MFQRGEYFKSAPCKKTKIAKTLRMGLPTRSVLAWERLYRFYKILLRRICTLLHAQKSTRKAPATFEAREAAGCGSLRLLRALDGTRILQAAAPTAPPCFGHWPRSSPLQTKGCSPLIIPKQKGSIQKIQVATLKDFLCFADLKVACAMNCVDRCFSLEKSISETTAVISEIQI